MANEFETYFGAADSVARQTQAAQATTFNQLKLGDAAAGLNTQAHLLPLEASLKASNAELGMLEVAQASMELQDNIELRPARMRAAQSMLTLQALKSKGDAMMFNWQLDDAVKMRDQEMQTMGEYWDYYGSPLPAKATRYGYAGDPYGDTNSLKGIGNRNNRLQQGKSVALSQSFRDKLGLEGKGGKVKVTFPDGKSGVFDVDDTVPGGYKEDRVDFYDPEGQFKQTDGAGLLVEPVSGISDTTRESIAGVLPPPDDEGPSDGLLGSNNFDTREAAFGDPVWGPHLNFLTQMQGDITGIERAPEAMRNQVLKRHSEMLQSPEGTKAYYDAFPQMHPIATVEQVLNSSVTLTEPQQAAIQQRIDHLKSQALPPHQAAAVAQNIAAEMAALQKNNLSLIGKPMAGGVDLDKVFGGTGGERTELVRGKIRVNKINGLLNELDTWPKDTAVGGRISTIKDRWSSLYAEVGGTIPHDMQRRTQFQSALSNIVNDLLKERSGAAVTDQEMARFMNEVGDPKKMDEASFVTRLRGFFERSKEEYSTMLDLRIAAASGDVNAFRDTGAIGSSSGPIGSADNPYPAGTPASSIQSGEFVRDAQGRILRKN